MENSLASTVTDDAAILLACRTNMSEVALHLLDMCCAPVERNDRIVSFEHCPANIFSCFNFDDVDDDDDDDDHLKKKQKINHVADKN
jgi:hypothetical protein